MPRDPSGVGPGTRMGGYPQGVPSERFQASDYPPFPSFLGAMSVRLFGQE
jgi:hypothetical protein